MSVRAVIFDLDGTLVDTIGDIAAAVDRALAALGRPRVDEDAVRAGVGRGVRHLMTTVLGGAAAADLEAACEAFERFYAADPVSRTTVYPDAAEALAALDAEVWAAVLSNKPTRFCHEIARRKGLLDRFAIVLGEDAVPAPKPDPRGLAALVAALGVAPAEAVYVGDSALDVETARAAGLRSVGLTRGYAPPEAVRAARPDVLLDDLRGLAAALGTA